MNVAQEFRQVELKKNPQAREVVGMREQNSKTFDLGGGKFGLRALIGVMHYKDDYKSSEQWKEIDTAIEQRDGKLTVTKAPMNVEIFKDRIGYRFESKKGGWIEAVLKETLKIPKPVITSNKVKWENVFPDVDIEIEVSPTTVVFWKHIKSSTAKREFKFEVKESKDERNCQERTQHIAFDEDGKEIYKEVGLARQETLKFVFAKYREWEVVENLNLKKELKYPLKIDVYDVEEQVGTGTDDAECKRADGSGYDDNNTYYHIGWSYIAGCRFQTVAIPQGATIDEAKMSFCNYEFTDLTDDVYVKISGEATDDAVTFASDNSPYHRTKTTAKVDWDRTETWPGGEVWFDTPDIKTVIKEIIDRPGWATGQDLVLLVDDDGCVIYDMIRFRCYDYWPYGTFATKLYVDYTVPPPPSAGVAVPRFHRSMSGYNLFVKTYVKYRLAGLSPIKTPDGQLL